MRYTWLRRPWNSRSVFHICDRRGQYIVWYLLWTSPKKLLYLAVVIMECALSCLLWNYKAIYWFIFSEITSLYHISKWKSYWVFRRLSVNWHFCSNKTCRLVSTIFIVVTYCGFYGVHLSVACTAVTKMRRYKGSSLNDICQGLLLLKLINFNPNIDK